MSDLIASLNQLLGAHQQYEEARAYSDGTINERWATARVAKLMRNTGTPFRLNFCRAPIDALLNKLEITSIAGTTPQTTAALNVIWDDNDMPLEIDGILDEVATLGETYLFVWPDENDFPVIHLQPPTQMRVIYDPENPRRKMLAVHAWECTDRRVRCDLIYPDRIERYITKNRAADERAALLEEESWEAFIDDQSPDDGVLDNPYGKIPVFHLRGTGRPYGQPVHKPAYAAQDSINKHVALQLATADFQALPQRYALTKVATAVKSPSQQLDPADWLDEDDDDEQYAGTANGLQAAPGSIMELVGVDSVGQFNPADPNAFLDPIRFYVQAMSTVTQTPMHLFEGFGDTPSGESLRAANAPLDKFARKFANMVGAGLRETLEFALEIIGVYDTVTISWKPVETYDDADAWKTADLKLAAGVPFEVVMQELGYPAEVVAGWKKQPTPTELPAGAGPAGTVETPQVTHE